MTATLPHVDVRDVVRGARLLGDQRRELARAPLVHREALVDQRRVVVERRRRGRGGRSRSASRASLQRLHVHRAAPAGARSPGSPERPPSGGEISGLEEMCLIRWSPASSTRGARRRRRRCPTASGRAGAGPRACGPANSSSPPSCEHVRDRRAAAPAAEGRDTRAQRGDDVARRSRGAASAPAASSSSRSAWSSKSSTTGTSRSSAQTSAPERSATIPTRPRWSMCWWVMTIRSRSSIRWPCSRERLLERVERARRSSARRRPA